jgi:hypothetical protein
VTRTTGDTILISDQTRRRLWRAELSLQKRDPVLVKGKQDPVAIYVPRVHCEAPELDDEAVTAGAR